VPRRKKEPVYHLPPVFLGPQSAVLPLADEVNWGMATFGIQSLRDVAGDAKVKVGVVDTGVDKSHPVLEQVVKGAKDFTGSQFGAADKVGHGTHCSGTVAGTDPRIGVASGFDLYHGKGLGDTGSGGGTLMDAIEYCLSEGAEVVSCSWGGGGKDAAWEAKFEGWAARGVWLVFAGGNSGPNTADTDWPGRSEHLLNVAALNPNLSPASFSSAGAKIDTSGPGVDIWSAAPGGGYRQMSGTSMATPFVAGMLALYRAALRKASIPPPTVYQLRTLMASRSTDTFTPGVDRRTGPGWATPLLLALAAQADPPPVGRA
jgi:subtilisin family serine protease